MAHDDLPQATAPSHAGRAVTSPAVANARMYAATPAVEAAWQGLLDRIAEDAGVPLAYLAYPAPQPLDRLWARGDLGAVLMCGFPIAMELSPVTPIAAPIPAADWAGGAAVYRTDLIVRREAPYRTLADTFGGTIGWTARHSHSGFNAPRHHLLAHRTVERPRLYRASVGDLVTPRRVLDAVLDGTIDVGPLDAYWHLVMRREAPGLLAGVRVLDSTASAPIPAFVASPGLGAEAAARLGRAFAGASARPWFQDFASRLCIEGFRTVGPDSFARILDRDRAARDAGYLHPE